MDYPTAAIKAISSVLQMSKLPKGVSLYEVDGQVVFPIRKKNGKREVGSYIFYLVSKKGKQFYRNGVELSGLLDPHVAVLKQGITKTKIKKKDLNSGNLGRATL